MTNKETLRFRLEKLRSDLEQVVNKLSLNDTMKEDHRNSLVYDKQELLDEKSRLESLMNDVLSEYQGVCQRDETDESNILIADFMEACGTLKVYCKFIRSFSGVLPYDHLMKVVDEINKFTATNDDIHLYSVKIAPRHCIILRGLSTAILVQRPRGTRAQEIIYVAVAEFALRFAKNGLSL